MLTEALSVWNSTFTTMPQKIAACTAAGFLLFNIAGRLGLLSKRVARLYWCVLAPFIVIPGRIIAEVINLVGRIIGLSDRRRTGLCNWAFATCLSWWHKCCGHMRVTMDPKSRAMFHGVNSTGLKGQASVILSNHTSFLDALIVSYFASWRYRAGVRVLYMARLANWPIIGRMFVLGGHFPVFFKQTTPGTFAVDAERQEKVKEEMNAFLQSGGRLMLFPEGGVNQTPEKGLNAFRHGTFKLLIDNKVPYVFMLTLKNVRKSWPYGASMGGLPANITMRFAKFETRYEQGETPEEMADRARQFMEEQLAAQPDSE